MIPPNQTSIPFFNGPLPMAYVPYILNQNDQFYQNQSFYQNNFIKTSQIDMLNHVSKKPTRPFRNYSSNFVTDTALSNDSNLEYLTQRSQNYQLNYQNNFQNNFNYNGNFQNNNINSEFTNSTINSSLFLNTPPNVSKSLFLISPKKQDNINFNIFQPVNSSETIYKKKNFDLNNQLFNSYQVNNAINNFVDYSNFGIKLETKNKDFCCSIPNETNAYPTNSFVTRINPFVINRKKKNCHSATKNNLIDFTLSKNLVPLDSKRNNKNSVKNKKIKMIIPKKIFTPFKDKEKNLKDNGNEIIETKIPQPIKNLDKNSNEDKDNKNNNLKSPLTNNINDNNMNKEKYNKIFKSIKNMFKEYSFNDNIALPNDNIFNNELNNSKPLNDKNNNQIIEKKEIINDKKIKDLTPIKENQGEIKKLTENINSPESPVIKSQKDTNNEPIDCIPEKLVPSDFKIIKQIGEGEFGKIYSVIWSKNNKKYAMKIEKTKFREEMRWSQAKIKIMKDFYKKTRHNGIIRVFSDLWKKEKIEYEYYVIMELAEKDWQQEITLRYEYQKYYTEKELVNILGQIISTCALLQKNHISHRDIKPQNILLKKGQYKLSDFGEAKILEKSGMIVQKIRGTEMFMSPILFFGLHDSVKPKEKISHNTYKSDVYSLGMCALFAATLSLDCPCDIRELKNMSDVENVVNKNLSKNYSANFISFILEMLEIDENIRPDFIELEQQILKNN